MALSPSCTRCSFHVTTTGRNLPPSATDAAVATYKNLILSESRLRVVIGNSSLAKYPQGGGHWLVRLQWLLGLRELGHSPMLLEILQSNGDPRSDQSMISAFFDTMKRWGLEDFSVLLLFPENSGNHDLFVAEAYGKNIVEVKEIIRTADILWNDCCGVRPPLLHMFSNRLLVDLDPGHLQVSCLSPRVSEEMCFYDHNLFATIGMGLRRAMRCA